MKTDDAEQFVQKLIVYINFGKCTSRFLYFYMKKVLSTNFSVKLRSIMKNRNFLNPINSPHKDKTFSRL